MADVQLEPPVNARRRFEILKRDGFTCQYCGRQPPHVVLHVDHIIPRSSGGTGEPHNLTSSCSECNQGKADGLMDRDRATPTLIAETFAFIYAHGTRVGALRIEAAVARIADAYPDWWDFFEQLQRYLGGLDLEQLKAEGKWPVPAAPSIPEGRA